jgi:hypothetical protein
MALTIKANYSGTPTIIQIQGQQGRSSFFSLLLTAVRAKRVVVEVIDSSYHSASIAYVCIVIGVHLFYRLLC